MAKNLQSKLTPTDVIHLYDINKDAVQKCTQEMKSSEAPGAVIEAVDSVEAAAKEAVRVSSESSSLSMRLLDILSTLHSLMSMFYL